MTDCERLINEEDLSHSQNYGTVPATVEAGNFSDEKSSTLKYHQRIGYALGHVFNDFCAGIWFSYTLLFLKNVIALKDSKAGALVMIGQVGDAIFTIFIGWFTDKYGTKRFWLMVGTAIVTLTFAGVYSFCPFCDVLPSWWKLMFYATMILLFQFGWPLVQITHLAMIPEIGQTQKDRADLTSARYATSVVSNILVRTIMWVIMDENAESEKNVTPADWWKFRDISLILTLIGLSMTALFNFTLDSINYEDRRRNANRATKRSLSNPTPIKKINFFKTLILYQNALLYVFSRIFFIISLVYFPLWLNERALKMPNLPSHLNDEGSGDSVGNIAIIPLIQFIASFFSAMICKKFTFMSHKVQYLVGSVFSIVGCAWIYFVATTNASDYQLYIVAILFGIGSSVTMIASLSLIADMIGVHADQGGAVYSVVTFFDKFITGFLVYIIEVCNCSDRINCPTYYQGSIVLTCGIAAILGIITLMTLIFRNGSTNESARQINSTD